jgi:hypothetical protein
MKTKKELLKLIFGLLFLLCGFLFTLFFGFLSKPYAWGTTLQFPFLAFLMGTSLFFFWFLLVCINSLICPYRASGAILEAAAAAQQREEVVGLVRRAFRGRASGQ